MPTCSPSDGVARAHPPQHEPTPRTFLPSGCTWPVLTVSRPNPVAISADVSPLRVALAGRHELRCDQPGHKKCISSSGSPSTRWSQVGQYHRASRGVPHGECRGTSPGTACRAPQCARRRSAPASSLPSAVNSYAARGGRSMYSLDMTSASRSSLLSRSERMFGAIPDISARRSLNRRGPASKA